MSTLDAFLLILQVVEICIVFFINKCIIEQREKTMRLRQKVNYLKNCKQLIYIQAKMNLTEIINLIVPMTEAIKNIAAALDKIPNDEVEAKSAITAMNDIEARIAKIEQDNRENDSQMHP